MVGHSDRLPPCRSKATACEGRKQRGLFPVSFGKIRCYPQIFFQDRCLVVWNCLGQGAMPDDSAEEIKLLFFFIPVAPRNAKVIAEPGNCFILGVCQIISLY